MENMPPGYRFYPTEEELISFYLHNKLEGEREDMNRVIPVVDIYDYSPWQLPQISGEASVRDEEQWFFFIPRQESEARGGRPKRLTTTGYWKATGSPNHVYSSDNHTIGMKRTMVFYNGRAPNGEKTEWKMNEYKAIIQPQPSSSSSTTSRPLPMLRQEYSLCRVYKKSKCLRAFDRRPPPRRETGGSNKKNMNIIIPEKGENKDKASASTSSTSIAMSRTSSYGQSERVEMSRGSSGEMSWSSGEEGQARMELEEEPLLDWEQVDWFLGTTNKP
ncbi:NAC domain-containing protein 90 [Senna tora]|uniref:NAC domain-containing protein 90 n=1 Tax=Senna tora TaxID=362788 RepID=A0A834WDR8_9FABA|nr:NAC domain-containing protein 90 [Senna tora]